MSTQASLNLRSELDECPSDAGRSSFETMQGPQLEDQLSRVDQLSSVHLHSQHRQSRSSGDPVIGETVRGYEARKLTSSREILLWMTPSEAPKALQASECSELLDPTGASCWIFAQR